MNRICGIGAVFLVVVCAFYMRSIFENVPLPNIPDIVWKRDDNPNDNTIYPFSIDISEQKLNYLKERLRNTTLSPPLDRVNFEYGFNTNHLEKIIQYWINDYEWKNRQKLLNAVPHFRTKISGLNIHFIHVKPDPAEAKTKKVLPILMLHGWPGSVKEFYRVFPLLTRPRPQRDFVFETVAPSLPGYGFSDAATIPGLNTAQIGLIMKKLMNRLGFKKFYVQGGDWGALIGSQMSTLYSDSIIGFHSNLCFGPENMWAFIKLIFGSIYSKLFVDDPSKFRLYPLSDLFSYLIEESGYYHLQATKPDTIGVALTDSPAGLAAYILEKFSTWENEHWRQRPDGGLNLNLAEEKNYSIDDLLDNVMIYWMTNSITSSMRLYSEANSRKTRSLQIENIPSKVPTACANYPHDLIYTPEFILRDKFTNLVHNSDMPKGGHFAAFEQPELFTADVWTGVCKIENFVHNLNQPCDLHNV